MGKNCQPIRESRREGGDIPAKYQIFFKSGGKNIRRQRRRKQKYVKLAKGGVFPQISLFKHSRKPPVLFGLVVQ